MKIEGLFAPGGALAASDPRYEPRPQQLEMARAVARALERGESLVVEAGTGVGKSLGYLLPGALWAVTKGRRLLVSTYTRTLQEQILEKELPLVARALSLLGLPLRFSMLQGAENYLCLQRLEKLRASPELFPGSGAGTLEEISAWARTAQTGHRSALPCLVPQGLSSRIMRDPDLCLGPAGRFWAGCLYRKDRERAEASHVLVVNHALLLSGARLPPYDALVLDEAHNLEEVAVSRYGLSVSRARILRLMESLRGLAKAHPELAEPLARSSREAMAFLEEIARAHGWPGTESEPGGRLLAPGKTFEPPASLEALEQALLALGSAEPEETAEIHALQARFSALRAELEAILGEQAEGVARWVEWAPAAIELRAAPLEVGSRLAEGLFARGIPVVTTSATLSAGAGLKDFKAHVGLEGARELLLDSPFDYESQASLLVLDRLPEPSEDSQYISALARECRRIVGQVPGGVFILFASWKVLRLVHERLRRRIKGRPVWAQGASGNEALLADFMKAGNAVLLGVDTFWQGVDVPGEALSCVVLVKLPFPNIASPIEEARRAWCESLGRSYFDSHSLPRAVTKFRQGFGRLIRSSSDRGAVVVLDSRLLSRGYGAAFLEALPKCRRLGSVEELGAFFESRPAARR